MSRVARQSVKVVLSGEGADEIFAGYPKYAFARVPAVVRRAISLLGPEFVAGTAGAIGLDRRRALVAAKALGTTDEIDRYAQWFSYFGQAEMSRILPALNWSNDTWRRTTGFYGDRLRQLEGGSDLLKMQVLDCLTWLPGNMLERGDRMTMAEGVEVRPPFLSTALCEFGLSIPDGLKVRGLTGKWIARRWARERIPAEILARPKWGFRVPLDAWFRREMNEFLRDHVASEHGLISTFGSRAEVERIIERHESGAADESQALWTILSAEVWYQHVFRPRQSAA